MTTKQLLYTVLASLVVAGVVGAAAAQATGEFRAGKNEAEHSSFKDCILEMKADLKEIKAVTNRTNLTISELKGRL
jgi:hypothetical protein